MSSLVLTSGFFNRIETRGGGSAHAVWSVFCRLDDWFNFVVKAIKTAATPNYEVLANVTQNDVSIVWKCHGAAEIGEEPRRWSAEKRL